MRFNRILCRFASALAQKPHANDDTPPDNTCTMKKSIVYTRTGDTGTTSLVGGTRVAKDSVRLEAYGTIDELNSHIGIIAAGNNDPDIAATLCWIQHRLFDIGGYLACDPNDGFSMPPGATEADIQRLENAIDTIDSTLPAINRFILPGGSAEAASTHVARCVCRRAERRIITLNATTQINPTVIRFINRLSDFLFVLARFSNVSQNIDEIFWQKNCQ